MNQSTQNQYIERIKKQPCRQEHCLSNNQDCIQVILINEGEAKKNGMMCSSCLIDTQLVQQLMPLQKHILPIRKYMALLIGFYEQYLGKKESNDWGPTVVKRESQSIKKKIQIFYNQGLKAALELGKFADSIARKATQSLSKIYLDQDFQKMVQFINQQNQIQQQRMMISAELTQICSKIRISEGKIKYATEDNVRKEAEEVLVWYRLEIGKAVDALKELVELHRQCMKGIIG